MIGYLVVGLLFVLVVVFAIMSWKYWHWSNVVFLILSFISAVAATIFAAQVLKLRSSAMRDVAASEKMLETNRQEADLIINGSPESPTYSPDSLRGVNFELGQETLGRGRIWRHGNVGVTADSENKVFVIGGNDAGAAASDITQLKGMVLYAFQEFQQDQELFPALFLGTVKVEDSQPKQLTLSPVFVVNQESFLAGGSWSLFESMPGDRHETFERANKIPKDISITDYRKRLTEEILPAAFFGMDPASAAYEEFIDQFAFDGRPIGEIRTWVEQNADSRIKKTFQPSPEEEFVLFKFDKNATKPYKVDATGNLDTEGPFTILGEAIDKHIHLGKDVIFKTGDELYVDRLTADGYQRSNDNQVPPFSQIESVTVVGGMYRRKLYDFPAMLSDYRRESNEYVKRKADVVRNTQSAQVAVKNADAQMKIREDLIVRLQEDEKHLTSDLTVITKLVEAKADQLAELKDRIERLEEKLDMARTKISGGTN